MRRFFATLVLLAWGLWFGGLIVLFLSVTSLFQTFPRATAGQGAAPIFHRFNNYQLALGAVALLATFAWRAAGRSSRLKTAMFLLFGLGMIAACVVRLYLAPHIELLQHQGLTHSHEFARFHGLSMGVYLAETICLCVAGLVLPWVRD